MLINKLITITGQLCRTYSRKMNEELKVKILKDIIPKLTPDLHKGQCGRIGVIGGSIEYTGAPYFAAISALKTGADLVHVFCCKEAGPVIKSYSPELIVHPVLNEENAVDKIKPWLGRLHALLIGPGLGRDEDVLETVSTIIRTCSNAQEPIIPLIVDADGLFLITQNLDLVRSYKGPVVLTPNAIEYSRLLENLRVKEPHEVAHELGAVLVQKGATDIVTNGLGKLQLGEETTMICDSPGSWRRCGGQGDVLAGCVSVFIAWFHVRRYLQGNIAFSSDRADLTKKSKHEVFALYNDQYQGFTLAAYAACDLLRRCSHLAYADHGRSMTASDLLSFIHKVFDSSYEHKSN